MQDPIKIILNLNNINYLEVLFNQNKILNNIFTKTDKKAVLSNINNIKKVIQNNITSSFNSLNNIFNKNLKNINISDLVKSFSEMNNIALDLIKDNLTE